MTLMYIYRVSQVKRPPKYLLYFLMTREVFKARFEWFRRRNTVKEKLFLRSFFPSFFQGRRHFLAGKYTFFQLQRNAFKNV